MRLLISIAFVCLNALLICQNIGINVDGSNPDPSAILDIKSDDRGLLIPRLSSSQRGMVSNPADGLLVYDTDTDSFWFFDNGIWNNLISSSSSQSDWYEEGTTLSSSTISQDIYRSGNVAIGRSVANNPLDIESDNDTVVKIRSYHSQPGPSTVLRIEHEIAPNTSSAHSYKTGQALSVTGELTTPSPGYSSSYTGSYNNIDLNLSGYSNYITGHTNNLVGSVSNITSGSYTGTYNRISPFRPSGDLSSGSFTGNEIYINGFGSGTEVGTRNTLSGRDISTKTGTYNSIRNNSSTDLDAKVFKGVYNRMQNLNGEVAATGLENRVSAHHPNATIKGVDNYIYTSSGIAYGEYSSVSSSFGTAYGNYLVMNSNNGANTSYY